MPRTADHARSASPTSEAWAALSDVRTASPRRTVTPAPSVPGATLQSTFEDFLCSLRTELRSEMKDGLRAEIRDEVKAELRADIRDDVKAELRAELRTDLRAELKAEIREEMQGDICAQVQAQMKAEVGAVAAQIQEQVNTRLTAAQARMDDGENRVGSAEKNRSGGHEGGTAPLSAGAQSTAVSQRLALIEGRLARLAGRVAQVEGRMADGSIPGQSLPREHTEAAVKERADVHPRHVKMVLGVGTLPPFLEALSIPIEQPRRLDDEWWRIARTLNLLWRLRDQFDHRHIIVWILTKLAPHADTEGFWTHDLIEVACTGDLKAVIDFARMRWATTPANALADFESYRLVKDARVLNADGRDATDLDYVTPEMRLELWAVRRYAKATVLYGQDSEKCLKAVEEALPDEVQREMANRRPFASLYDLWYHAYFSAWKTQETELQSKYKLPVEFATGSFLVPRYGGHTFILPDISRQ